MKPLSAQEYTELLEQFQKIEKSFNAMGYPHLDQHGRTGMAALARMSMDKEMLSIAASEKHIHLMKDVQKLKATSTVYQYTVKTSLGGQQGQYDLAGVENFIPAELAAQFEKVTEPLKIYGVRAGKSEMVELVAEAGGLEVDPDQENEMNSMTALTKQFEQHAYSGGDYYLTAATGALDPTAALVFNRSPIAPVRQARGIQANVREGDIATRGVSQDFIAYGNSFSVIYDLAGQAIDQDKVDDLCAAIDANMQGTPAEAHANPQQITEFRKQLFTYQRGDISSNFKVGGPDVHVKEGGFEISAATGPLRFMSCPLKYSVPVRALPWNAGSSTNPPAQPTIAAQASTAITGRPTAYAAGATVRIVVQACSINGGSSGAADTMTVTNATESPKIRITHQANTEYYALFINAANDATVGREMFVGRVLPGATAIGGNLDVSISDALLRGCEPVVVMPDASEDRVKLAVLGSMINKIELGRLGSYSQKMFTSYLCFVMKKPRAFGLLDNPLQRHRSV